MCTCTSGHCDAVECFRTTDQHGQVHVGSLFEVTQQAHAARGKRVGQHDVCAVGMCEHEITARDVDVDAIRRRIGIVFQSFNLFPHMSVLRNVTLAPEKALGMEPAAARARAEERRARGGRGDKRDEAEQGKANQGSGHGAGLPIGFRDASGNAGRPLGLPRYRFAGPCENIPRAATFVRHKVGSDIRYSPYQETS